MSRLFIRMKMGKFNSQLISIVPLKALCSRWGIVSVCYGHAGDGNIHVNLLKDDLPDQIWEQKLPEMIRELFTIVKGLGGALTGEHGVGYSQREYMSIMKSPAELDIMRRLKLAFDPLGILNPGKILPETVEGDV